MNIERFISLTSIVIVLSFPQVYSSSIDWWCYQTPYPEECKYHTMNNINVKLTLSSSISRKQFLTMAEQTALQEVNSALQFIKTLGRQAVVSNAERHAWRNCLFFYSQTVYILNKALDTTSTFDDIQTFLSDAATNIHACLDGFIYINKISNMYPLVVSSNLTQLISNCLAVNSEFLHEYKEEPRIDQAHTMSISKIDANPVDNPDCVVAQDGSGHYTTIAEALVASAQRRNIQFVIYVKQGIYNEIVNVQQSNIVLIGDGMDITVITGKQKTADGLMLFDCATLKVSGEGFKAIGITFENTAGVDQGPAVAMASISDCSVFYKCSFKGYQDTLYAQSNRQFYKSCDIYGTVDFIFGNASAVFQDCTIYARKPITTDGLVVTAQARDSAQQNTGFTIHRGSVKAAPELTPFPQYKAFLGRPWREYSRTVYLRCMLDDLVDPAGWMTWNGAPPSTYSTLDYGEFENYGPGASTNGRVTWPGYHVINDLQRAETYDVTKLINGLDWLPATGVPFDSNV